MVVEVGFLEVVVALVVLVQMDESVVVEATWADGACMVLALLLAAVLPCALSSAAAPPVASHAFTYRSKLRTSTISNYIFESYAAPFIQAHAINRILLVGSSGKGTHCNSATCKERHVWVVITSGLAPAAMVGA